MNSGLIRRGMLRAGGWGYGLAKESHVALRVGRAGTQPLARNVSHLMHASIVNNSSNVICP